MMAAQKLLQEHADKVKEALEPFTPKSSSKDATDLKKMVDPSTAALVQVKFATCHESCAMTNTFVRTGHALIVHSHIVMILGLRFLDCDSWIAILGLRFGVERFVRCACGR